MSSRPRPRRAVDLRERVKARIQQRSDRYRPKRPRGDDELLTPPANVWQGHSVELVIPAIAAWLAALLLIGLPAWASFLTAGIFVLIALSRKRILVAVAIAGCAVSVVVGLKVHGVTSGPLAEMAKRNATVSAELVVSADPRVKGELVFVEARIIAVNQLRLDAPVLVFARGDTWPTLLPSHHVKVSGRLGVAEPGELLAAVFMARGDPVVLTPPSTSHGMAGAIRSGLREASSVLAPAERGLLPGLVVGDVTNLSEDVKADFKTAGLSHLTAVSGANLAIIGGAVLLLGRLVGLTLVWRAVLVVVAMVAFAFVARFSPSVLRALVMGTVAALALGAGRQKDGVSALSVAVLLLLLFNPGLAREFGFALSVSATAGIILLAPYWRDRMATRMPLWCAEAIAVPAAAQVAVTPILVLMSGEIGLVAIPANLLAGPAVAPATIIGFLAAVTAPISMDVAQLVTRPAGLAVGWIILVADRAADVPAATIGWPGGLLGVALLVPLGIALWHRGARRVSLAVAGGVLVATLVAGPVVSGWPPSGWFMVMCDVGQGDAIVLHAGEGKGVVVDTGPEPDLVDACLDRLDVDAVPLLVLTHPHADHTGGLTGVLRDRPVGAVVVSPKRVVSPELAARRIPEWVVTPGTTWRFGDLVLTVVAPAPDAPSKGAGEGSVLNNASVVLHAKWPGTSALLAGDLETEAESALVRTLPQADILKVPHHGSARQDPAFLAAARSRLALISVGAGNDYGHPADSTLATLTMLGARIHRTDVQGDIAVVAREGVLAVVARGP
ncbi:DNA internalization-related competence protein ComEC/Rec2 [Herbidospora sp. NEAU-GS84]|uniref:DNA internalization-related competence protein ComEC/Rec2 n=1 Tax=Herbidospora solisilvae TaxID=2696284 RepID=A0A7C9J2W5_9ACTN|nr:DNA internalization-related competence protein ComEC/Rec2 [Herbidospora solisilvae]NAS23126.1 DNA internalization-related competence protein ComEC/Rec2 [Herbidospora solisilvae]